MTNQKPGVKSTNRLLKTTFLRLLVISHHPRNSPTELATVSDNLTMKLKKSENVLAKLTESTYQNIATIKKSITLICKPSGTKTKTLRSITVKDRLSVNRLMKPSLGIL